MMTNFFKASMKLASSAYQKLSPLTSQLEGLGEAFLALEQDIIHIVKTAKNSFISGFKSVTSLRKATSNTCKAIYRTGLAAQAAHYNEEKEKTNALRIAGQEIYHAKEELVESFKAAVSSLTEILGTAKHSVEAVYHTGAAMSNASAATIILGVESVKAGAALANSLSNAVTTAYESLPANVVNIESAKTATNLVLNTAAEAVSQFSHRMPSTDQLLFKFNNLNSNFNLVADTQSAPKPADIEMSYLSEQLSNRYASPAA